MRTVFLLLCLLSIRIAAARDLARYDKGGTFDFPLLSAFSEEKKYQSDNARLREFVWSHWAQHRRGHVRVIHHGIEGQTFVSDHFIEPDRNGRWSMSWGRDEAMRIYGIEQIQTRADFPASRWRFEWMGYDEHFWKAGKPLVPVSNDGTKFMLQLRDQKRVIVALF